MNVQMKGKQQKGFTIIELVVVILLLGILAATALPRFLDVTDEAHEAVVDGVQGGLQTGAALFRATWVAQREPRSSAVAGFGAGNLYAGSHGYPIGLVGDLDVATNPNNPVINSAAACESIYNNLLQGGRPEVADVTQSTAGTLLTAAELETAAGAGVNPTAQFLAEVLQGTGGTALADSTGCRFSYVGQYRTRAASRTIPVLTFTFSTGEVVRTDLAFAP